MLPDLAGLWVLSSFGRVYRRLFGLYGGGNLLCKDACFRRFVACSTTTQSRLGVTAPLLAAGTISGSTTGMPASAMRTASFNISAGVVGFSCIDSHLTNVCGWNR